jgi:release factor glutamine methyltransferase
VDIVVGNPPYVDPAELEALEPEVRDHEPRGALVAAEGRDALYARLAREAAAALKPGGFLALEVGAGMAAAVERIVSEAGLRWLGVRDDLAHIPRVVVAERGRPA